MGFLILAFGILGIFLVENISQVKEEDQIGIFDQASDCRACTVF